MFDVGSGDTVEVVIGVRVNGESVDLVHRFRRPTGADQIEYSGMVTEAWGAASNQHGERATDAERTVWTSKATAAACLRYWERLIVAVEGYSEAGVPLVCDEDGTWKAKIPAHHKATAMGQWLLVTDQAVKK